LTHTTYRQAGNALMVPVPPPVGRLRREEDSASRGRFTGFYRERTVSDYLGVLAPEGRALAVELKSVSEDRWYLSQLAAHQAAFLELWAEHGGLAYVLVVYLDPHASPHAAVAKWPAFLREIQTNGLFGQGLCWETLAYTLTSTTAVPDHSHICIDYLPAIRTVEERSARRT
jgi:penicillin-binding protein-related factor A (putative recombinase)